MRHVGWGADVTRPMWRFGAVFVVIIAGCTPAAPSPALRPTPTSTTAAAVAASPTPIPTPQPTLFGEFPGPSVTVPPGQPVIENLRFNDLAALWASLGLSCFSHTSGGPESPANYNVHCEHQDSPSNAWVIAEANYWTVDAVATLSVTVLSITTDGSIDHEATAVEWVYPFAALAGGDSAVSWVKDHLDDSTCGLGCSMAIGNSDLSYSNGTRGANSLDIVVRIPVRSSLRQPESHVTLRDAD
jgi:hypothetical protein